MLRVACDSPWWSAGLPVRIALQTLADTVHRLGRWLGLARLCLSRVLQFLIVGQTDCTVLRSASWLGLATMCRVLPMLDCVYTDGSVYISCKLTETCKADLKQSVVDSCLPVSKTRLCPVQTPNMLILQILSAIKSSAS